MTLVTFYLKTGSEIEVVCEKIDLTVGNETGDIVRYQLHGQPSGSGIRRLAFLHPRQIAAVTEEPAEREMN